ncbi:MAG: hypothetical protein U0667_17915 [Chloroflexota bacterium]
MAEPDGQSSVAPGSSSAATPDASPSAGPADTHDPERRAFFRLFGRQAVQTVAQVAGMASAVSQMPTNALTGLVDLASPPRPAPLPTSRPAVTPAADAPYRSAYRVAGDAIHLLDQRKLPDASDEQVCRRGSDVAFYLRVGAARGGPLMAQLAAYGLALSALDVRDRPTESRRAELRRVGRTLAQARPGSRLLRWAVDRAWALADALPGGVDGAEAAARLRADADARAADADLDHALMARHLEAALPHPVDGPLQLLVHGNPGALSSGLVSPVFAAIASRHATGAPMRIWVTETRPLMDGARLASWELATLGIEHTVLPDAAVGALFERERIDAVLLGGEWVAANGDVGAISGSRVVAGMAATASGGPVPVFVVAPIATFDPLTADGRGIPTDDRPSRDLQSYVTGTRLARTRGWNPGVDVVPRAWVGTIVTEMGAFAPGDGLAMTAALEEREARRPIHGPSAHRDPADPIDPTDVATPSGPSDVADPTGPAGIPTQGAA